MPAPYSTDRTSAWPSGRPGAAALARAGIGLGVVAAANVAAHRALPYQTHLPVNVATAATVSLLAVGNGATIADLGLDPARVPAGLRAGLVAGTVVAAGAAAVGLAPATAHRVRDTRVEQMPANRVAYEMTVRIPFATAFPEELLFRGALPTLLAPVVGPAAAEAVAVALFGAWHVLPTIDARRKPTDGTPAPARARGFGPAASTVAGTVVATAIAGIGFRWLARRSGSIVTPTIAHAALNATMFAMVRRRARS